MPVTVCDLSDGPHRGRIYVNWVDERNGADDRDVWVVYSDDHGNTWSEPVRVNDDPAGAHQFLTWMTVDQHTGNLFAVFYDRRGLEGNLTHVYLAVSENGGKSFENICLTDEPFDPNDRVFFGDYNHIAAHNGMVRPVWTRLDGRKLSVWTALVQWPKSQN
jgi:Neuraminidase (sialidase)